LCVNSGETRRNEEENSLDVYANAAEVLDPNSIVYAQVVVADDQTVACRNGEVATYHNEQPPPAVIYSSVHAAQEPDSSDFIYANVSNV